TLVGACLGVLAYAFLRPHDPMVTALHADLLLGLDERISTALEDAARPPANPSPGLLALRDAQLDDALRSLAKVVPARDIAVALPVRQFVPSSVLMALTVGILLFPAIMSQPGPNSVD